MRQSKVFITGAVLTLLIVSCIKRFDPAIDSKSVEKYIVTGEVIKGDSIQHINISTTASISLPWYKYYIPVTNCNVMIVDNKGNSYYAKNVQNGNYECYIPDSMITTGTAFKVDIYMAYQSGDEFKYMSIVSDYDTITDCPDVDSVYYQIEELSSLDPSYAPKGIRFYCDLNAQNFNCRNFRFEVTETWEYKAKLAPTRKVCWTTSMIKDIYLLSTNKLAVNKFEGYPFHFVDNYSSQRLIFGYSLLIKQYSLSPAAYQYWEKLKVNYADQGGLYEKQPLKIKGNMHNLSDTTQQVLGFFGASTLKSKRIFVKSVAGLPNLYINCEIPLPPDKPNPECFDCLLSGGTTVKPAFWPY